MAVVPTKGFWGTDLCQTHPRFQYFSLKPNSMALTVFKGLKGPLEVIWGSEMTASARNGAEQRSSTRN